MGLRIARRVPLLGDNNIYEYGYTILTGGRQGERKQGKHPQTDLATIHPRNTHKPTNKTHAQDTAPRNAHNHAEKRTLYYFFEKPKKYNVDNSITYKDRKQKPEKSCKDHLTTAKKMIQYTHKQNY